MVPMAGMTMGMSGRLYGIMTQLCASSRDDLMLPRAEADEAQILVTGFYMPNRVGFLVRVRHDVHAGDAAEPFCSEPYLHLAVMEHGTTGEPVVTEWIENAARIPRTTGYPDDCITHDFGWPRRVNNEQVMSLLIKRIRLHIEGPRLKHVEERPPVKVIAHDGEHTVGEALAALAALADSKGHPALSVSLGRLATMPPNMRSAWADDLRVCANAMSGLGQRLANLAAELLETEQQTDGAPSGKSAG